MFRNELFVKQNRGIVHLNHRRLISTGALRGILMGLAGELRHSRKDFMGHEELRNHTKLHTHRIHQIEYAQLASSLIEIFYLAFKN